MAFRAPSPPRLPDLDFEAMTAEELIPWTHQYFWPRVCLTCSWQKQSSVLVHMVAELGLRMDTVELDTHLFFRESYDTRDALVERYQLKLIQPGDPDRRRAAPRARGRTCGSATRTAAATSARSSRSSRALQPYDAWISGIRRDQSPSRADTPKVQWSERYGVFKIHPLADWDEKRVWAVHQRQRDPLQPAARRRVPLDRLHSVHPSDEPRRGGARRPLGRLGQARVRHPRERRTSKGDSMSRAHLRARAPRVRDRPRRRLHALVHRPLRLRQDDDRAPRRARARPPRPRRRVPGRRHGAHAPLEGPRLLEGGPRHEHRADRLGRLAPHAPRRRRDRGRDLAVRRDARRTRARSSRSSARSSRSTSRRRSTSARAAT